MMKRYFIAFLVIGAIAFAGPAWAKDFKFMPSIDGGSIWFFMLDKGADKIVVEPAPVYGGSVVQIVDFEWARNMAFEASYHHSESRGEWMPHKGDKWLFDLKTDYATGNIGYFFSGRKIHPYMSGGFGATWLKYVRENNNKIWETNFTINVGAGVDFTVWEPPGGAEQFNLGVRVRYIYVFPHKIVDAGMNAIAAVARIQMRF